MANAHAMPRISSDAPDLFAGYAAELGALWYDDVNLLWKKCTSLSPLTFTSIEGAGGGAPTDAQYVCLATNGTLTNERVLTAGANVTITDNGAGNTVVIAASGGAGASWTEAEIDFGSSKPKSDAVFTVTDAAVSTSSKITVIPCGKAATGRTADDWQWDGIVFAANPGTGEFTLYANVLGGCSVVGPRKIQYSVAS